MNDGFATTTGIYVRCVQVCGGERLEGPNHWEEEPAIQTYTGYHTGAAGHYNQERKEIDRDAGTRRVESARPGEIRRVEEGRARSQQSQTARKTGRQLHGQPGSFMSQLRCALWRVFKGLRMHLMRPAWWRVHTYSNSEEEMFWMYMNRPAKDVSKLSFSHP